MLSCEMDWVLKVGCLVNDECAELRGEWVLETSCGWMMSIPN